ncbi:MAG: helix-turn-helix domain-containing protein [Planctomycetota bacterium]|jgi:excisionase family DNA binding protein
MQLKDVLTTGEVADLLKVTTNTVAKWFDAGLIDGFKHPGSNTRRISKQEFLKFTEKHDIPVKRLQKEPFLTTAQCARLCFVTTNTITKWIDRGLLTGFSLGTERRLVFHRDLIRFMKDKKIPLIRAKDFVPKMPGQEVKKPKKKARKGAKRGPKKKRGRKKKRKR